MGSGGSSAHQNHRVSPTLSSEEEREAAMAAAVLASSPDARSYSSDEVDLTTGDMELLRAALNDGPLRTGLEAQVRPPGGMGEVVAGDVELHGQGRAAFPAHPRLRCSCGEPDCAHQAMALAELTDRLRSAGSRTVDRAAMRTVLDRLEADREASEAALTAAGIAWPDQPEVSYLDDPDVFQAAYASARERRAAGLPPVPYLTEDATGGLGARDGGRSFGVEIEFDFAPGTDHWTARRAIAREMHDAGLSPTTAPQGYHASAQAGYSDDPNTWRLEEDSTVAGEIVSPILWDEPQTWRNLGTVCDIVKRHGGRATVRAGGHVHVSAHNYDHTVENHNRLLQMVGAHEDTIYRLSQNPYAADHRGLRWCYPNDVPSAGYTSISSARNYNSSHNIGVNMQSMHGGSNDHVEFRSWDASLDPGVIQAQVKLSLGLTEAAFRSHATGTAIPEHRERVGEHLATNPDRRRLAGQAWRDNTASFRRLADTLFHRAVDKAQVASLFAVTRWQSPRR